MADPERILKRILTNGFDAEALKNTGESLDLLVDSLREVMRCRRFALWLEQNTGLVPLLQPAKFHSLLDIPEINFSEEVDRNLDVTRHSLKDMRDAESPITVANLNAVLREMFRELNALFLLKEKEYPRLLIASSMSGDRVDRVEQAIHRLRGLDLKGLGFMLTGWMARGVEKDFEKWFPEATRVHPLRRNLDTVQTELGFYHRCLEINIKWSVTGLDLFRLIREDTLGQAVENLSSLGNGMWNVVYNGMQVQQSLNLCGIDFSRVDTLLDESLVPLKNS